MVTIRVSQFGKSVAHLVGGTAAGQAILLLMLPVLTRIYSPSDFGVLAVYIALLSTVSVVGCLRFDVAIALPELEETAINLLVLALISAVAITVFVIGILAVMPDSYLAVLGQPKLISYIWLLPVGVFCASVYSALQYWAARKKRFKTIGLTRVSQSISAVAAQLSMGWLGFGPVGLIIGHILSNGAAITGLGRKAISSDKVLSNINLPRLKAVFLEYDRFPKYSAFEALANSGAIQIPIVIIGALTLGAEAGYLLLAMRVMQAPLSLLGNAVSQVYLSDAGRHKREGKLSENTTTIIFGLLKVGVGPLILVGIIAPELFTLLFGKEWGRAGILVSWMTPWFVFQFLVSPVATVLYVQQKQKIAVVLHFSGLLLRVGSVWIAAIFAKEFVSEVYAVSGGFFYFIYLIVVLAFLDRTPLSYKPKLKSGLVIVAGWTILGFAIKYVIGFFHDFIANLLS